MSEEKQGNRPEPTPPPLPKQKGNHSGASRHRRSPDQPERRVNPSWLVFALLAAFLFGMYFYNPGKGADPMTQIEFRECVESNQVDQVEMVRQSDGQTYLQGTLKPTGNEVQGRRFRVNVLPTENLEKFLLDKKIPWQLTYSNNWFQNFLPELLGLMLMMGLFFFFIFRQVRNANGSAMGFGKSRARLLNQDRKKVLFSDVGGVQEAKEEVQEIVEYLKAPDKFQKLGGKIPKGVLLMGPQGTGKTLFAKAIAGEAGVPFFSISGSDFVEMFVGVGASRVRDMFEQGKRCAPCLIFIDEIDAVGRSRFSGIGGGHDEREQTLNALLVEMDGFDTNEGVIIIAATNRADVLDPALLRPGRFDRQIVIDLPTLAGRLEILKMHSAKIKMGEDCDLDRVARGTPGFSGADLANLLNEAALLAARRDSEAVSHMDLEEARDKVLWGRERKSRELADKDRETTAWHEAGHALLQVLLPHTEPLHKVTIIPRGRALGATMSLPEKDVLNRTKNELLDMIAVTTGGRIAEELFTGDISTGARADIKMASDTARKMVCAFGMSDLFGFQSFGDNQETVFIGKEYTRSQAYSEETAKKIDAECARILSEQYHRARKVILDNRPKLESLVRLLLEKETVDGREVETLLNPPPPKDSDEKTAAPAEDQTAESNGNC